MENKIKILWLSMHTPVSVAPAAGGQTFNFYFKSFLNDSKFDLRLISCGKYKEQSIVEKEVESIRHHIIYWNSPQKDIGRKIHNLESRINPFNKHANLISNADASEMKRVMLQYKKDKYYPDFIIMEWTNVVLLAKEVHKIFPNSKMIASEHDVTFIGYERKSEFYTGIQRMLWQFKYHYEKKKELESLSYCDIVLPHNAGNKAVLVREGIEAEKIHWLVPYYKDMSTIQRESNRKDILFFGAMSRPENSLSALWFIEKVMPLLKNEDVRFVILGGSPSEELKSLESNRIHVTGFVDDIEPYFQHSMCLVAPLVLGAGIKVKILEALSSGILVLTNDIGIEGIPATPQKEYFHCTEPEEYARAIKKMIVGEINNEQISRNAREFMQKHFSPYKSFYAYRNMLIRSKNK